MHLCRNSYLLRRIIEGIYRHFKGNNYKVIGEAFEQSTWINYIFYRQLYSPFEFWIRLKEMFFGQRDVSGVMVQRFVKISDSQTGASNLPDQKALTISVNALCTD